MLQIFSSFLFVLLMFGILSGVKTKVRSKIFFIYGLFSALYLVNILRVLISNFDLSSIKLISKISMISLIFYYFKKHINLRLDFILIINAFIKSAIPTIILGIIDFLVIGDYQKNREFVRFDSSYGDIATLGLQLNILCIIMFFNILKEHETSFGRNYTYNLTLFLFSIFFLYLKLVMVLHLLCLV